LYSFLKELLRNSRNVCGQLKVTVPVVGLAIVIGELSLPEHTVWLLPEKTTFGEGFTVTTAVNEEPIQLPDFGIMV
jgi:hypothetical protein